MSAHLVALRSDARRLIDGEAGTDGETVRYDDEALAMLAVDFPWRVLRALTRTEAVLEAARAWAAVETTPPQPSSTGVGDWAERREAARDALLAAVEASR